MRDQNLWTPKKLFGVSTHTCLAEYHRGPENGSLNKLSTSSVWWVHCVPSCNVKCRMTQGTLTVSFVNASAILSQHLFYVCNRFWLHRDATMDTSAAMDLMTLFRRVPPLLQACIWQGKPFSNREEASGLRALRLVCKEASGVALLALRSFTLTLMGPARCPWTSSSDTIISGAKLLKETQLKHLKVCLLISGECFVSTFDCYFLFVMQER